MDETTVRDVMKDRLVDALSEHIPPLRFTDLYEIACELADEAFSVCGISEKEQDEPWKE